MAKTDKKKTKSSSLLKRGKTKMTGDDPIDVDTPPPEKQKDVTKQAEMYFSTTCKKGYTVNPWLKGSKNYIDVVFHDGGVPDSSEEPNITLDEGGKALHVEWKLPRSFSPSCKRRRSQSPLILRGTMGIVIPRTK